MHAAIPGICHLVCKFVKMGKIMDNYLNRMSIGGLVLGIFIISWGIVWLGNDMGLWNISFPFWPIIVILAGFVILLHGLKNH